MYERNLYEEQRLSSIQDLNRFMTRTFAWMGAGLLVTAFVAYLTLATGLFYFIYSNAFIVPVLIVAQLVICVSMGRTLYNMDPAKMGTLYFAYAALTGITFSSIGILYDFGTIFLAFGYTAFVFACLCMIGKTTKMDMTSAAPVLFAGLLTAVIVSFVNIFLGLEFIDTVLCYVVIGLFLGITVYDVQRLKNAYYRMENDSIGLSTISLYGAFQLYLDFINIFLRVLQIFGKRNSRN